MSKLTQILRHTRATGWVAIRRVRPRVRLGAGTSPSDDRPVDPLHQVLDRGVDAVRQCVDPEPGQVVRLLADYVIRSGAGGHQILNVEVEGAFAAAREQLMTRQ